MKYIYIKLMPARDRMNEINGEAKRKDIAL